ncbi:DUF1127 domain-containing protein [Tropicimonas sp. IMCC34043]|uniref:DUF1127 domain-containing protein n=1 Tax=Tropicimonas sp. IMCC34043 TaxID=2248760 RepID=UPI001E283B90|nr:DUF1127 domain-containing protein [Tropicimonas sp. IMCC34043]
MSVQSIHTAGMHRGFNPLGIISYVRNLRVLARQRRELAMMDDHMLQDIGVSRFEAESEATRPLWDVPHFWMK